MTTVLMLDNHEVAGAVAVTTGPASLRQHLAARCVPDVVVLDIREGDGVHTTAAVHQAMPESRLLVVGPDHDGDLALACLRAGASGALTRDEASDGLYEALRHLTRSCSVLGDVAGQAVLSALRAPSKSPERLPLTPMQERILSMMATGATNRAIASRLGLAEKTVKNYATAIYAALGASNRTQAVALWTRRRALD